MARILYRLSIAILEYIIWLIRKDHRVFVAFQNGCRLGNQMFVVSYGETLRTKYKFPIYYYTPIKRDYLNLIDGMIFSKVKAMTFHLPMYTVLYEKDLRENAEEKIKQALKKGNVLLSGLFEDVDMFDLTVSRKIFQRPKHITAGIREMYGDLSNTVSIHVRRGDFVKLGISSDVPFLKRL